MKVLNGELNITVRSRDVDYKTRRRDHEDDGVMGKYFNGFIKTD